MICICCGGKIAAFAGRCRPCQGLAPTKNTSAPARACPHTVPVTIPGWPPAK